MPFAFKLLMFIELLFGMAIAIFYGCASRKVRALIKPGYVALILMTPVIGLFGGSKEVFYGFLFVVPLLTFGDRRRLACVYALMLPLYPELSENFIVGPIYLFNLSAWAALNIGTLVALILWPGGRGRRLPPMEIAIWLFFLITLFIGGRGVPLTGMLRIVGADVFGVIPAFYVMARCIRTREDLNAVVTFMLLGAACNAVVAIFETRRHWPLFEAFYRTLNVQIEGTASLSIRAGLLRAQGAIGNPATLSVLLAFGLVGCMALRSRFSRLGYPIMLTLFAIGVLVSQSRGGWIAAVCGVAIFWAYERRSGALATVLSAAIAGALVLSVLPSSGKIGQLLGRSGDAQATADYRSSLLVRGIEEILHHPLRGQTGDELEVSMNDLRQGQHIIDFVNTHLYVALKAGLIGFAAWLAAWALPAVSVWKMRPRKPALNDDRTPALPLAMLAICFVALTFTPLIDRMVPFIAMSMGLAYALIVIRGREAKPAREKARSRTQTTWTPAPNSAPTARGFGGSASGLG